MEPDIELIPATHEADPEVVYIFAGHLFNPYTLEITDDQLITISTKTGLILEILPSPPGSFVDFNCPEVIDLRNATVLPGFVDVHVHLFLHPYSETSWQDQLTKETLVERTIRATNHAKRTLMAGFTAVRDLGTEGAGDADIAMRKCLSGPKPLIPGPRYFCANRAIVCTGSYGPKSSIHVNSEGIEGITGAEVADGRDECIKAVRRQIGAGADWIKIYADYRFRTRMSDVSKGLTPSVSTFCPEELETLIKTAHHYGVKVAAHCTNRDTIRHLRQFGVDSIEHGDEFPISGSGPVKTHIPEAHQKCTWVPTLAVYYTEGKGPVWERVSQLFKMALAQGVDNIACGGDTGPFAHGENALEMQLMVRLGADWKKVLRWGTLGGWECIRSTRWEGPAGKHRLAEVASLREDPRLVGDNEVPFGAIRRGFAADIIATTGDLAGDFENAVSAKSISFVMKGGKVYKQDGKERV